VSIDFRLYQFTVHQASAVAHVSEPLIRAWKEKGTPRIGHRFFPRRLRFSVLDLIQLATMFYLSVRMGVTAPQATRIAASAAEMADQITGFRDAKVRTAISDLTKSQWVQAVRPVRGPISPPCSRLRSCEVSVRLNWGSLGLCCGTGKAA
jgi:hypothetical protein